MLKALSEVSVAVFAFRLDFFDAVWGKIWTVLHLSYFDLTTPISIGFFKKCILANQVRSLGKLSVALTSRIGKRENAMIMLSIL
jgi:hypothetical protein